MKNLLWITPAVVTAMTACSVKHPETAQLPIDTSVTVYGPYRAVKLPVSSGVRMGNPTLIALSPQGVVFAANRTGEIYTLRDTDGDGLEDTAELYAGVSQAGLRSPSGIAFRTDTLYVGTAQQVRAYRDSNADGKADTSWVFYDQIPHSEHPYEWTSGLCFGPDGWLYAALTTDSWNAGASPDPGGFRGSIIRISPDGSFAEPVANGIRSVYGMAFTADGELFFADNEGGGNPTEELNLLVRGGFYGHNPGKYKHDKATGPVLDLKTEIAPSGIEFRSGASGQGPALFVAFYGPGERWNRGGLARVDLTRESDGTYSFRETPLADIPKLSDLAVAADGSIYVSHHGRADYWYNAVFPNEGGFYKLIYDPALEGKTVPARAAKGMDYSPGSVEMGRQLYAEHACLACHATDGTTELLGPNLRDAGRRLSREEILEEILEPSKRIKPSMMATRVVRKDGQTLLGRIVNAGDEAIELMVVGNQVVKVRKADIDHTEDVGKSLMYEGLLAGLSAAEREALLDYIMSLPDSRPDH